MSRIPVEPVSDVLLLAAVERAERHRESEGEGVLWRDVVVHLGFDHGPWTTRRLRPQREVLLEGGLLYCPRRLGLVLWALTDAGRRRLARARRAGQAVELPESLQHRQWHDAREAADERIGEFADRLRGALAEAGELLVAEVVSSDGWFELGERLQRLCWTLGSATYCLREWPEPDDVHADIDDHCDPGDEQLDLDERHRRRIRRPGRRKVRQWDDLDSRGASAG